MKINISLDDELVKRIEDYADRNYMSRSGCISYACTQFLNQEDTLKAVQDLGVTMRKIADTGKIDSDTRERLEDFERFANMLFLGSSKKAGA